MNLCKRNYEWLCRLGNPNKVHRCVSLICFYLHKSMTIYSSASLSDPSTVPLNPKQPHQYIDEATPGKDWPILNKDLSLGIESSRSKSTSSSCQPSSCQPSSCQSSSCQSSSCQSSSCQPSSYKPSSCKQCQFCSHFQLELVRWGRCSVLNVLVPGQAPACILHEPFFSKPKAVLPLAQLKQPTRNEEPLNRLKSNAYYQYPSTKGRSETPC